MSFADLAQLGDKGNTRVVPRHVQLHDTHINIWCGILDDAPGLLTARLCAAGDDHVGAELGEMQGRCKAQTRCASSDEDCLAFESAWGWQGLWDEAPFDALERKVEEYHGDQYSLCLSLLVVEQCGTLRPNSVAYRTPAGGMVVSLDLNGLC